MGDVIFGRFKPRLIQPDRTPAEDLEFALKTAWDRQAARMFCKQGADDLSEGSEPGDAG